MFHAQEWLSRDLIYAALYWFKCHCNESLSEHSLELTTARQFQLDCDLSHYFALYPKRSKKLNVVIMIRRYRTEMLAESLFL